MLFTVTVKVRLAWEQKCAQCRLLPVLWICIERHTCPRSYPGRADMEEGTSSDIMINPLAHTQEGQPWRRGHLQMAWSIPHSYLGRTYMEEGALDAMINHSLIPRPTCVGGVGGIFRWHKQFLSYPRRADCTHHDFSLHIPALSHGHHRITILGTGVETL